MNALDTITIHGNLMGTGEFFIWGTERDGRYLDAHQLRLQLFAWDPHSFYGTMIETRKVMFQEGLILTPLQALHFLTSPAPAFHLKFAWDHEIMIWQQVAPIYMNAIHHGWYLPSFDRWKEGRLIWELRLPQALDETYQALMQEARNQRIKGIENGFDVLMNDLFHEPEVIRAWMSVLQEHPLLHAFPNTDEDIANLWLTEEEWLIALGLKGDNVPFRTCLQLVEPEEDEGWKLNILLQDKENGNVMVETNGIGEPVDGILPQTWSPHVQDRLAKDIAKWRMIIPWMNASPFADDGFLELTEEEAWEFLNEGSLQLVQAGYTVLLPAWWEEIKTLKPKLKAKMKSSSRKNANRLFGLDQLMDFDWKLAMGEMELSEHEFLQMVNEQRKLMRIRGKWITLHPDLLQQIQQIIKKAEKNNGLSLRDVLEMHLLRSDAHDSSTAEGEEIDSDSTLPIEVELNSHLQELMDQLQQKQQLPLHAPPTDLNAELRNYQNVGTSWLLFLRRFGLGGCLADDMGLGKTIQFIAYMLHSRQEGRTGSSLLICPTSVLGNWQKELERFAPSLQFYVHHGTGRLKDDSFAESVKDLDLVITSYSLAHIDQEELGAVAWDTICLDEAQNIKNANTKQASAIRTFQANHRIALTGTPIENRLTELWSIFDFINPGYLGSQRTFTEKYASSVEKNNDAVRIGQVQKLVRPFLLRRVKKDPAIQLDLPDKNEMKTYVSLTPEQAALYENIVQDLFEKLQLVEGIQKRGLILGALTKLKQVCNHPALFLKETGNPVWEERSNKMTRLLEMIQELRDEGDKCLIFTQYIEMGHLIKAMIEQERGESVQFLHGGIPKAKRDQMIARFQGGTLPDNPQCGIFILSLKAGGTGLNLTAANHVFHVDRWWNPAVENQATDRAFRIGQTKDVQVHKFITLGTLEERIDEMIDQKKGLSEQIVGTGENWITEMSTEQLKELFTLRKEWIGK